MHGTAIPVPAPVAFCPDSEIIGAPFYLMEYVDGLVLRSREDGAQVTPDQARQLSERLAEMLAAIHGLDLAATGLTEFGRPDGYLARQLARWQRQWELSATREMPGYDRLVERLAAGLPASERRRAGARRLPARQHAGGPSAAGRRSRPSSTGRCRRSVIRSPTWG